MKQEAIRLEQQSNQLEAGFGYRFGRQLKGEFASLSKDMKQFEARVANKIGSAKLAKVMFFSAKVIFIAVISVISLPLAAIAGFLMALLFVVVKAADSGVPDHMLNIVELHAEESDDDPSSQYEAAARETMDIIIIQREMDEIAHDKNW